MSIANLVKGRFYQLSDEIVKYDGSYTTSCYFEDIDQKRSIRIHRFFCPGGRVYLTDREVGSRLMAVA